jgi:hypothetical protein
MNQTNVTAKDKTAYQPVLGDLMDESRHTEIISISCYENEVPTFVEAELQRLYGNLFSSLPHLRFHNNRRDTSTYIVRKGETAITIFLYQHDGSNVRVLNQVIRVDEEDMTRFSDFIFSKFATTTSISFDYVITDLQTLSSPYQRINISEDIVLKLPDSLDSYLASLGKNTRRNIKRYTRKLLDASPSFCFEIFTKEDIPEQTIRDIISMNQARMDSKQKVSAYDEIETEQIIAKTKECGLVCVGKIDGKVCAGSVLLQVESNYFFSIIAHDSRYDDFCLGYLCTYRTISECIARRGNEFHFLWGEYEYKYSLLGVKRELEKVAIYRSRAYVLFNGGMVLRTAIEGYIRQGTLWLLKAKREDYLVSRFAIASLNFIRRIRRLGANLAIGREEEKEEVLARSPER